jgi:hypothetical protein
MTDLHLIIVETERHIAQFDCYVGGQFLLRTTQPLCDAARLLLTHGHEPDACLIMRRKGREQADLRARLGIAAALTVKSDVCGKPVFVHWKGAETTAAASPVRKSRQRVGGVAPDLKRRVAA